MKTMKTHNLFVPTFHVEECLLEIRECLEKGWTGLGFKTVEFENSWKVYTGLPYAHFLNSATSGLHLAVKLLKEKYTWEEDSEVISTPLTFISTNHAISYENLKVVFADVDEYLCLDPKSVRERITDKTKAVMFVGFGGSTGQYKEIEAICKEYDLCLILDAAHMAGTQLDGETPGKTADAIVYSFQAGKNLPTADSGMVCFKDADLDARCRKLAWMGINKDTYSRSEHSNNIYKWKYNIEDIGYKYHGNSVVASIALVQLKYLDEDNQYRKQLASWYRELLEDSDVVITPIPENCNTSQHLFTIQVPNRDEVIVKLNERGINPGVHYIDNTLYKMYEYGNGKCPNAASASEKLLSLPLHLQLSYEDIKYISNEFLEIIK